MCGPNKSDLTVDLFLELAEWLVGLTLSLSDMDSREDERVYFDARSDNGRQEHLQDALGRKENNAQSLAKFIQKLSQIKLVEFKLSLP